MAAVLSTSLSFSCQEAEPLLHLVADAEVAPEDQALLDEHLKRCGDCRARLVELRGLKAALRLRATDTRVPASLLARVREDIADEVRTERRRRVLVVGAPVFAGFGALLFVSAAVLYGTVDDRPRAVSVSGEPSQGSDAPVLLEQALSLHTLDVPVDVASPDPARVSAFLAARIGHPVRVPRLDPAGFGLAGARVINVDNRRAAQLFYEGGLGHRVSLVAVPDPTGQLGGRVRDDAAAVTESAARFADWVKGGADEKRAHLRARRGDLAVQVWSDEGAVYSLAGRLDDERFDTLLSELSDADEGLRTVNARRVARDFDPPLR